MRRKLALILMICVLITSLPIAQTSASAEVPAVYKHLSIANGANSKLFLEAGETDADFTPFVDYFYKNYNTTEINYDTEKDTYKTNAVGIEKVSGLSTDGFLTDKNDANIKFKIDTAGKAVFVGCYNVSASNTNDNKAILNSINSVTVDLEDGYYQKLYFAARNNTKDNPIPVLVTYTDGTSAQLNTTNWTETKWENYLSASSTRFVDAAKTGTPTTSALYFQTVSVDVTATKKVDKITIATASQWRNYTVIGITGKVSAPADIIAALPEAESIDNTNIADAKEILSYLESNYDMKKVTDKTKYNAVKDKIAELEAVKSEPTEFVNLPLTSNAKGKIFIDNSGIAPELATKDIYKEYYILPNGEDVTPEVYPEKALAFKRSELPADGIISDTANEILYRIDESGAVMRKYYKGTGDSLTAEQQANLTALKAPEIEVENGFYNDIYLLAGSRGGATELSAEVVYADGTSEKTVLQMNNYLYEDYLVRYWTYPIGGGNTPGAVSFRTYPLKVSDNKIVDKIVFEELKSPYVNQIILAVSANKLTAEGAVSVVQADINTITQKAESQLTVIDYANIVNTNRNISALSEIYNRSDLTGLEAFGQKLSHYTEKKNNKEEFCIYVDSKSTQGDGSLNNPFSSIEQARDAIRNARKIGLEDVAISVIFKGGTYSVKDTVSFTNEDSGNDGNPVRYKASDGERVVFSGATAVRASADKNAADSEMLKRFPEAAADKLMIFDLKQQGINSIEAYIPNDGRDDTADVTLFYKGVEQPVAQWPNGDESYARSNEILAPGTTSKLDGPVANSGGSFRIDEEKAALWQNVKQDTYITGNFAYLWNYNRVAVGSVNPAESALNLYSGAAYKLQEVAGGLRYKINHLPEELDAQGEWYLDRENLILYYYPPHNFAENSLEIAFRKNDMISLENCENIEFSGISFEKSRGKAIYSKTGAKGIIIEECDFNGIADNAVMFDAPKTGEIGVGYENGAFDCKVSNCNFSYIGGAAIIICGSGVLDTLTSGNNLISNNYIYRAAQKTHQQAIHIEYGIGVTAEYNLIHNVPMYGIYFDGTDHIIRNNEIYNIGREGSDVGAIYTCYGVLMPGTEIAYNYLHDAKPIFSDLSLLHKGIYLDGSASGNKLHHNIISDTTDGIFVNGSYNEVLNNTIVGSELASLYVHETEFQDWAGVGSLHLNSVKNSVHWQDWLANCPELENIGDIEDGKTAPKQKANIISGNIHDGVFDIPSKYGKEMYTVSADSRLAYRDMSIFVNPEQHDFRVKAGAAVLDVSPDVLKETDFDMNTIGLQRTEGITKFADRTESFGPLFPYDGQMLYTDENLVFSWSDAPGADYYEIIIATDAQMQNIVYKKQSDTCFAKISDFKPENEEYFWNIRAISKGRQLGGERMSTNGAYSFRISALTPVMEVYKPIDIKDFCNVKLLIDKGETDSDYELKDYWNHRGLNESILKSHLDSDNSLYVGDVKYTFTQLDNRYKAVNPYYAEGDIAIDLPEDNYKAIHFLGNFGSITETKELEAEIVYSDNMREKHTLNLYSVLQDEVPMIPRLTLSWIEVQTGEEYVRYCQLNSYSISPELNKPVKQIVFCKRTGDTNLGSPGIFAVTAEQAAPYIKNGDKISINVRNHADSEKPYQTFSWLKSGAHTNWIGVQSGEALPHSVTEMEIPHPQEAVEFDKAYWSVWSNNLQPYTNKNEFPR